MEMAVNWVTCEGTSLLHTLHINILAFTFFCCTDLIPDRKIPVLNGYKKKGQMENLDTFRDNIGPK